jgi:DNA-directed RNA polymerase specialized sigma24 family protein
MDFDGWLFNKARWLLGIQAHDRSMLEDLVQEGRIAMWRAGPAPSHVKPHTHLMNHAQWRMSDVARSGGWLGKPKASNGAARHRDRMYSEAEYVEPSGDSGPDQHAVNFGSIEVDYDRAAFVGAHSAEIRAAVATLTPLAQQRIREWFWEGNNKVSWGSRTWWDGTRGSGGARRKLRTQLAHLENVVAD